MIGGGTPKRKKPEYWENPSIPWVKIGDLHQNLVEKTEEMISKEGYDNSSAKLFPKNTVLVSIFASVGKVGLLKIDAATNQAIVGIQPDNSKIMNKYLYYFLKQFSPSIQQEGQTGTQKNINLDILKKITVKYCQLPIQKKIISVIDQVYEIDENRKESMELTEKLILSIFIKFFGDPATNPKKWPIIELSKVLKGKLQNGLFKLDSFYGKGTKTVWVENISTTGCKLIDHSLKQVNLSEQEKSQFRLENKDILITRSSHLGRIGVGVMNVVDDLSDDVIFESHIIRMKLDSEQINPYFLVTYFKTKFARQEIFNRSKEGTMTTISQPDVRELPLFLPPINLQNKFEDAIREIEPLIENQTISESYISNLLDSINKKIFES